MKLQQAVKELRAHLGLTQQEFAVRAGLSVRGIAGYEGGSRTPEPGPLAKFAEMAAQAGRHDLAYVFARAIFDQLHLERLQVGIFSAPAAPNSDSPGLMLVTFRGQQARDSARAFFETFGRFLYGNEDQRTRAATLLKNFIRAAMREWQ